MGMLAKQKDHLDQVQEVVSRVLSHFDKVRLDPMIVRQLAAAADLAFSDPLLFEKFQLWSEEPDDKAFLFHIGRFFEKRDKVPFTAAERDFSLQRETIETSIKESVREKQKKIFAERLTKLAIERSLLTNEQLGEFLGVSAEQARKYKSGEFKPQLVTLKQISGKFRVSIEFLSGISDER